MYHYFEYQHIQNLNKFDNSTKTGQTLILPLNFWFCKDIGSSLPTVALSNTSVAINLKINSLRNLIYFEDLEQEYYNFLRDLKYSGWVLLAQVIIAALFVGFMVFKINK